MQEKSLFWLAIYCLVYPPVFLMIWRLDRWRRRCSPSPLSGENAHSSFRGWQAWAVWASYPCLIAGTGWYAGAAGWFFIVLIGRAMWKYDYLDMLIVAGVGVTGYALSRFGRHFYNLGRQARTLSADQLLAHDPRPLVLYLRSFLDDSPMARPLAMAMEGTMDFFFETCEEQVAEVFREFGPVVAIGKPGDVLPELGAARVYVADNQWRAVVQSFMGRAGLVVFLPGTTEGIWWEIELAARLVSRDKIVFLIHADLDLPRFRQRVERVFMLPFPPEEPGPPKKKYPGNLKGIVYFDRNQQPHYLPICSTGWWLDGNPPVWAALKMTLMPVFEQMGIPWTPPPFSLWIILICLLWLFLAVAGVCLFLYLFFWK